MPLRDRRILVTGATGFIGSHVARACVREGATVACTIREGTDPWRLLEALPAVARYNVNLEDQAAVTDMVESFRPHIIMHLAARINRTRDLGLHETQHAANVRSTLYLVRAALKCPDLTRFVYTGTIEEYGRGEVPFKEIQREEPITPYSLTKHEGARLVLYASGEQGLPGVVLRPSLTYGPLQSDRMFIPDFIRCALTTKVFDMSPGDQTRDFLHVDDAARAYCMAAAAEGINGEIFNIATGIEMKLKHVAERLRAEFDNDIIVNYGARPCNPQVETMRCFMDISKARERLGWEPKIDLATGLKQTVRWYRDHASIYEHIWN